MGRGMGGLYQDLCLHKPHPPPGGPREVAGQHGGVYVATSPPDHLRDQRKTPQGVCVCVSVCRLCASLCTPSLLVVFFCITALHTHTHTTTCVCACLCVLMCVCVCMNGSTTSLSEEVIHMCMLHIHTCICMTLCVSTCSQAYCSLGGGACAD